MISLLGLLALQPLGYLIENVTIISPGSHPTSYRSSVLIRDGKFERIAAKISVPKGITKIDGKGKYLIPGMWDMHVHWYDEKSLGLFTANGVTGIRIMFGQSAHKSWREKAGRNSHIGPRVNTAGPIIDGKTPFWNGSMSYDDPARAPEIVAMHQREKWDFIKSYSLLRRDPYFALMREAKRANLDVCGHVPFTVTLLEAAEAGHRSNEHLDGFMVDLRPDAQKIRSQIDLAFSRGESTNDALSVFATMPIMPRPTAEMIQQYAEKLAKAGMWQCPTMVVNRAISHLDKREFISDSRLKYIPEDLRKRWQPANDARFRDYQAEDWQWARKEYEFKKSLILPLMKAKTRFLAGTDCLNPYCFPGFSLHDELELFVEAGLSPMQALETATINPAQYLKREGSLGAIRQGFEADAVLLSANPLTKISNTRQIFAVIQRGRMFERRELDQILQRATHPLSSKE